jgi:hypothetical protein
MTAATSTTTTTECPQCGRPMGQWHVTMRRGVGSVRGTFKWSRTGAEATAARWRKSNPGADVQVEYLPTVRACDCQL